MAGTESKDFPRAATNGQVEMEADGRRLEAGGDLSRYIAMNELFAFGILAAFVLAGPAGAATARVNGYVAGYGSLRQLEVEIESLGLSESGSRHLRETVRRYEARKGNAMPAGISCPVR